MDGGRAQRQPSDLLPDRSPARHQDLQRGRRRGLLLEGRQPQHRPHPAQHADLRHRARPEHRRRRPRRDRPRSARPGGGQARPVEAVDPAPPRRERPADVPGLAGPRRPGSGDPASGPGGAGVGAAGCGPCPGPLGAAERSAGRLGSPPGPAGPGSRPGPVRRPVG